MREWRGRMIFISALFSRLNDVVGGSRRMRGAFWLAFLLSSALIVAAARGDLWLDELMSLSFARTSHSITDIFVRFHYDNNHPLNTVFLYLAGVRQTLFIYRSFAVLSGIGSVFLVGYIAGKHWGAPEALCSIVLTGTSYPLLLYFSEARGYAPAIFFALAAYALLQQNWRRFHPARLVLFWAASILGVLSHSTFIMATIAFCIASLAHEIQAAGSWRQKSLRLTAHHAPPLVFFAWWYGFFLKDMVIAGGPIYSKWAVLTQASALLMGFPETHGFMVAAAVVVLAVVAAGLASLGRERDPQWTFFLAVLVLAPALVLIATRPTYLYFRYFIVCFPFFYLVLSRLACRGFRVWPNWRRWLLAGAVAMLIAGQTPRVYSLLILGRGSYSNALAHIAERSPSGIVCVGGDQDFRNHLLFAFYAPRVPGGNRLRYIEQPRWGEYPPDWFILQSQDLAYQPPRGIELDGIGGYHLTDEYRFSGISGWGWFVFRRATPDDRTEGGKTE
jgi:hypothetical protein